MPQENEWTPAGSGFPLIGSCTNIASEKKIELMRSGFAAPLFFALVYRRNIGVHAILVSRLADGDWALDSRTPWIEHWYDVPYTYIKIQSPDSPLNWFVLTP